MNTAVETCLDEDVMLALLSRRATNLADVQTHLDRCAECRAVFAELVKASRPAVPRARASRAAPGLSLAARRSEAPSADVPAAGEVIAERFVLDRLLGEGTAGVVWAARALAGEPPRALKFLRTASAEHMRRMRREAAVLGAVRHPNIVIAHEIVESARGPVLVMELLEGESLEKRLAGGKTMSLAELAPIACGVASALEAAHARGVVHRDLKPANVFLDAGESGRARVLDFGMAKLEGGWQTVGLTPAITRSGTLMGTPLYMAPEQLFCERTVDGRADLWSLGVMLYRALCGRLPVEARTLAELMKRLTAGTVRRFESESVASPVPPEVAALVDRLLSIDREVRPTSREVLDVLASCA